MSTRLYLYNINDDLILNNWSICDSVLDTRFDSKVVEIKHVAITTLESKVSLIAIGGDDMVKIWHLPSGELYANFPHDYFCSPVKFSNNGSRIISIDDYGYGSENTIKVWRTKDGLCLNTINSLLSPVLSIDISMSDNEFAVGGGPLTKMNEDKIKIYNFLGEEKHSFGSGIGSVKCVAYSKASEYFAAADVYGTINIWKLK